MANEYNKRIDTFGLGMTNDLRSADTRKCALASHFDIWSNNHKLCPRPGTTDNTGSSTDIVKTIYVTRGSSFDLIGLDISSGSIDIKYWNGSAWASRANMTAGVGGRHEEVLFEYKNFTYVFGGNYLKRADTYDSSSAFDDDILTTWGKSALPTITSLAQPVLHPTDDIAYFFVNNLVYSLDAPDGGGAGWALALTLPDNLKIVQGFAYGNYLGIACVTKATITKGGYSVVYLWDRDSSLETVAERIDFGLGIIRQVGILDNQIIAVMDTEDDKKIVIKRRYYNGSIILNEIDLDDQQVHYQTSQIINNRLHFPMKAPLDSDNRLGIWAVDSNGRYNLDFVDSTLTTFDGIYYTGDVWWICGGGTVKTSNTSSGTSIYKSLKLGDGNKRVPTRLGIQIKPVAAQAACMTLEIKRDNNNWETIFADKAVTNGKYLYDSVNIESTGADFDEFREIQLRATITDKDVCPVAFILESDLIDSDL